MNKGSEQESPTPRRPKVKNNNNTMKRRSTSLVSYQGNANEKQN